MVTSATPAFVIVGGVNGCGKSTFARAAAGTELLLGQTAINPDELTLQASAEIEGLDRVCANVIGVERAEKAVWRAIAEGASVAVETVLSSEKFFAAADAARYRGFRTRLVFIALPTVQMAIERVAARVKAGGHGVPNEKIRGRWSRAHENLVRFLGHVDDVIVFSNAGEHPVVVAERIERHGPLVLFDAEALPEVRRRLIR